ncbi:MAG TPA: hypothetical protein P5246_02375, partial [Candidatus Omnitrophota bacterium]|nr:hypothetical protein [Candidatus Omnitrophota bacterium]
NTIKAGRTRPSDKAIKKLNKADNDYYGTIFLLAVFGTIIFLLPGEMRSHQAGIGYLFLTLAYYFSIIALTMGHRKYRFAIEPFFCLLAAYGISFFFTPPKRIES